MLVAQWCPTLCDPSPVSSDPGILQERILDWVIIPFSRRSSQPRAWTQVACNAGRIIHMTKIKHYRHDDLENLEFYGYFLVVPNQVKSLVYILMCIFNVKPKITLWLLWKLNDTEHAALRGVFHTSPILGICPRSVQFSSVAHSCPTLCDPMNCSTPSLPVHHQPLGFSQTHVHQVSDAIQPSHPLSSPSPPAPNPSQHQSLPTLACVNLFHLTGRGLLKALGNFKKRSFWII